MKSLQLHFEQLDSMPAHGLWRARAASRVANVLLWLACAATGLACSAWIHSLWLVQTELAQANEALRLATASHATGAASQTGSPPLMAGERAAWARLAGTLNTPWNTIFDTLERSIDPSVALISIEPNTSTGRLRLQAEAPTLDTLLGAVRALEQAEGIARVELVGHQTQDQQAERPLRITMDVQLRGSTP